MATGRAAFGMPSPPLGDIAGCVGCSGVVGLGLGYLRPLLGGHAVCLREMAGKQIREHHLCLSLPQEFK